MKAALSLLAGTLILVAIFLAGCVPGLQTAKPTPEGEAVSPPEQAEGAKAPTQPGQGPDQAAPPPPPDYIPPPPPDREKIAEGAVDLSLKDEVNASAMRFAKEIPNVKHVKTCFSKLYGGAGGWYLMLYVQEKKKITMQQYSWNRKSKEWEVAGPPFDVPAKELEGQFKAEVGDEKCFRLK